MVNKRTAALWILVTLVAVALVVVPAGFAAKGGNGGGSRGGGGGGGKGGSGSSLSLVVLNSTDGVPHYGQDVTFEVSTGSTDTPYVNVRCYQGSAFVYDAWAGFYSGAWFGQTFTLTSSYWSGGSAECTSRLVMWGKNGKEQTLASLGFHVEP